MEVDGTAHQSHPRLYSTPPHLSFSSGGLSCLKPRAWRTFFFGGMLLLSGGDCKAATRSLALLASLAAVSLQKASSCSGSALLMRTWLG